MKKPWTIHCAYVAYFGATVTVEAETLEQACSEAIRHAHANELWKNTGDAGNPYIAAACEGAAECPWDGPRSALPVPDRFSEHGPPPLVTLSESGGAGGGIEVAGGTVRIRFVRDAGTLTAEVSDPPPPPGNKPVVTIRPRHDGAPRVDVRDGTARIRICGFDG